MPRAKTALTVILFCAMLGGAVILFEKANGLVMSKLKSRIPFA